MQLNLPPGSKCFVCDRTCGGKKKPLDSKCLWCGLCVSCFSSLQFSFIDAFVIDQQML